MLFYSCSMNNPTAEDVQRLTKMLDRLQPDPVEENPHMKFWHDLAKHPRSFLPMIEDKNDALSMLLSCIAKDGDVRGLVEKIFNIDKENK